MVKDLPGFYFDTERNRYFPLSSRPSSSTSATRSSTQRNSPERKRFKIETEANEPTVSRTIFHRTRTLPSSTTQRLFDCSLSSATRCNSLITHDARCSRFASTSRFDFSQTSCFGNITEFCSATTEDGLTRRYIGDDRGWFYTGVVYGEPSSDNHLQGSDQYMPIDLPSAQTYMWPPDINLHSQSEVSSIKVSGQTCVTTCFGPITKVAVQDLRVSGRTTLITFNKVHDVRGSHFQDGSLILGAKSKAVYIPDINESGYIQYLYNSQNSDIFALDRDENIVYTGARNGSITRHDLRVPSEKHGHWLFQSRFSAQNNNRQPSSVSYLKLVKQSELIVSQMNGELCTYDTRFPLQNSPSRQFRGHRNSVTSRLGICVDPAHDFLFAAGEDYCIRGWSLRTGQALHAYDGTSASTAPVSTAMLNSSSMSSSLNRFRNPFKTLFPKAVSTLQVTEESDGSLCLWAGCQQTLYRYFLGQYSKEP
ncbi:WD40-repeat-containing domain protein [Lentinula raphanica]|nr:WD40-repeat-containing domain protein [Lentinula raphanica]